jgi:hypothetical protein
MILRPGRTQRISWALQHLVCPIAQEPPRLFFDMLGVVGSHRPVAVTCDLGQDLEIHDRVGPALVRHTVLDCDVCRKVGCPRPKDNRRYRFTNCSSQVLQRDRSGSDN